MKFKILDLFSGAGGLSYGFDTHTNFETVLALDNDKKVMQTFGRNFPHCELVCGDITSKDIKDKIVKKARKFDVNMIIGGPPCQGFSNKGKKMGLNDERNFLFLEYLDIVKKIKPEVFVMENVKTMITAANGYFISEIEKLFTNLGYIVQYDILNSYDFGVPQKRERAFVIGTKDRVFNFESIKKNNKKNTVRDAISDLTYLNSGEGEFKSEYLMKGKSGYQLELRKNSTELFNHMATNHTRETLHKLSLIPAEKGKEYLPLELRGNQKFKTTWGRLEWDKPSPTIDTRFDTPSNGTNTHPTLNRAITPREAARIQSFPDDFVFWGNRTSINTQIGNAVPPKLSNALAIGLANLYEKKDYKIERKDVVLYHADAYDQVKILQKQLIFVDHIITDPPFSISQTNSFNTMKNPRAGIYFGDWDNVFDLYTWIGEYGTLLKPNGSFIVFCSYRFISHIIDEMERQNLVVKDIIRWNKTNPMPRNIKRRYVQDTEFAIWAVKKKSKWIFNKPDNVPYLRTGFNHPTVLGKERTIHPTQKSLDLMKDIVKIHTNKNQIILDPFMGSGTTGVAALELERKFIGIELDEKYYKIASERMLTQNYTSLQTEVST